MVDKVPSATQKDIQKALDISQKGKIIWADTPLYERTKILEKYAELLQEHKNEISSLLCKEMGKLLSFCQGEVDVASMIFNCRAFFSQSSTSSSGR